MLKMSSCNRCTKENLSERNKCTGCQNAYYCSKECQRLDWEKHKSNCRHASASSRNIHVGNKGKSDEEREIKKLESSMKKHQIKNPDTSLQPSSNAKPVCYERKPTRDKGMGMFATRDIKSGELILQEPPVLSRAPGETSIELHQKFKKLSNRDQEAIMSLWNNHDFHGDHQAFMAGLFIKNPEEKKLWEIFHCNYVPFGIDFNVPEVAYKAMVLTKTRLLFLNVTRFNHGCIPNSEHFISASFARVFACQDIKIGEEICTNYRDFGTFEVPPTRENVRKYLQLFEFDCKCELCRMANEKERTKLETYRVQYWEMDRKLANYKNTNIPIDQGLGFVKEIFELLEKARLLTPRLRRIHAYQGFELAVHGGKPNLANQYIKEFYEASKIMEGDEQPNTKLALNLMENPQDHIDYVRF